ncbi:MAG: hypothetical protein ACTSRC_19120 [Candidatus Helarchaeota archaeon]
MVENIIFTVGCLKSKAPMKQKQKTMLKDQIYECTSCQKPHKISIRASQNDFDVICLACNQEMQRIKTLNPSEFNYQCKNAKCQQRKTIIQIHQTKNKRSTNSAN